MKKLIKLRCEDKFTQNTEGAKNTFIERILATRGVDLDDETNYSLQNLTSPDLMLGVSEAVSILIHALKKQEKVLIVGDFDADGATSCAVAMSCLNAFGFKFADYLVPNRFEYGYGLTPEIVTVAAQNKPDLIITVDNGISSLAGVSEANNLGMKVIVTDHHLPGSQLPKAAAIVNPNQPGCPFPSKCLAGVGVIFYLMSALRKALRVSGWFAQNNLAEPNMAELLDLVALGTVADVVPLDHNNRILVYQGLARIKAGRGRPGIQGLIQVAKRDSRKLTATDLGFALGPRLNAAGRLDDMSLGIQCLMSEHSNQAMMLATELDSLNRDRQAIEKSIQSDAVKILASLEKSVAQDLPLGLCLYQEDWHQGVIGIVASRIKEKFYRPTIVFAKADDGQLKGSGRSIEGVHLRDVLDEVATQNTGLLTKFGGHAMAAGMSLSMDSLEDFKTAFNRVLKKYIANEGLTPIVYSDGELLEHELIIENAEQIIQAGPWGQAFPEPSFHGEFHVVQHRVLAEKHLKLVVSPIEHSTKVIDAIAFNFDQAWWPAQNPSRLKLVYRMDVNEYRGNQSLQLIVEYFEAA